MLQMNRPIQVKPADSESRGGTVCPSLLPSVPLCPSPTNMLPVYISFTIICPVRRCTLPRMQADSATWLDPPVFRTHYINRAPNLESHHMHWWIPALTQTQKHKFLVMVESKTSSLFCQTPLKTCLQQSHLYLTLDTSLHQPNKPQIK